MWTPFWNHPAVRFKMQIQCWRCKQTNRTRTAAADRRNKKHCGWAKSKQRLANQALVGTRVKFDQSRVCLKGKRGKRIKKQNKKFKIQKKKNCNSLSFQYKQVLFVEGKKEGENWPLESHDRLFNWLMFVKLNIPNFSGNHRLPNLMRFSRIWSHFDRSIRRLFSKQCSTANKLLNIADCRHTHAQTSTNFF